LRIAPETFWDDDTLTCKAYQKKTRLVSLPAWLSFDQHELVFKGTPVEPGSITISLRATDSHS
jgi:hypothetical protein